MRNATLSLALLLPLLLFAPPAGAQVSDGQVPGEQVPDGYEPSHPMPMDPATPTVLLMEERAAVVNDVLETRLDTVVAQAMRAEVIDLWIVSGREVQ